AEQRRLSVPRKEREGLDEVLSLAFDPGGRTLAAGTDEGQVLMWQHQTGELRATLAAPKPLRIMPIAFSADGRYVAGACRIKVADCHPVEVTLWDLISGG